MRRSGTGARVPKPPAHPAAEAAISGTDERPRREAALAAAARERRYERREVRRFTSDRDAVASRGRSASAPSSRSSPSRDRGAYSPLMALREVRVEGAQRIPAEVARAFDDELGTPLPLVASDDVHDALADFPLIETYSTETIPPGTLVVRIVERTPVGVIETEAGSQLVDAAGVVIERPTTRPEGQPLITVEGGIAGEGFRAVGAVVRSLPADVRAQLDAVTARPPTTSGSTLGRRRTRRVGSADESGLKATVLAGS